MDKILPRIAIAEACKSLTSVRVLRCARYLRFLRTCTIHTWWLFITLINVGVTEAKFNIFNSVLTGAF